MASKKISALSSSIAPSLNAVVPLVDNGVTLKSSLSTLRQTLVDSGSHHFTGSQWIYGDLTVSGSGYFNSLLVGTGSFFETNPEALHVENSGSFNIGYFQGNHPQYAQINVKNNNSGNRASTDIVVTADNGTDTVHYVDLGINSSTYNGNYIGRENDGYVVNAGNDLYVGTIGGLNHPSNLYLFAQNNWRQPQIMISGSKQIGFNTETVSQNFEFEFSGSTKLDGNLSLRSTIEDILYIEGATDTVEHDFMDGSIFYHSGMTSDFIVNFINVPTDNNKGLGITIILNQGNVAYIPTEIKINGGTQMVNWANGELPIGSENKIDIFGINLIRLNGSWTLLGQYSTFG